jgi:oligopeptide transport system substrate-binding protein
MNRLLCTTHLVALLMGLHGACASRLDPTRVPRDRVFSMAEIGVEYLDPNLIAETAGSSIALQLFEPVVTVPNGDGAPVAGQAERWQIGPDGRTYTFFLRRKAKWSDGKRITAQDHIYSWRRLLHPETRSRMAQLLWFVRGAKEFNLGRNRDFNSVGVRALDDYRIQIDLGAPAPFFLDILTKVNLAPVPRHTIERLGEQWTREGKMVSNGPFRLAEWKLRERIVLEKNPHYWNASEVWLEKIIIYLVENETLAHQWYEQGKVLYTPNLVPVETVPSLLRTGRKDFHVDPYLCVYYFSFNTRRPPFDQPAVRQAFNMALDKGRLTRQVLGQGQEPATHLIPPHFKKLRGYPEIRGDGFDPARARALLRQAGYGPDGKPFPDVVLIYNTFEGHRLVAEFFQNSIQRNLGIAVRLENLEWKSLLKRAHTHDFNLIRGGWCADYPDPQDFLNVFDSQGENNYAGYQNKAFDALLAQLTSAGTQARRNELAKEAERLLNRDVPVLPIYFYTRPYMLRQYVRGFQPRVDGAHSMKHVRYRETP